MLVPLPSWKELYLTWWMVGNWNQSPVINEPTFLPVYNPFIDTLRRDASFDWWPKQAIDERMRYMNQPPPFRPWKTLVGTQHTVFQLWEAQGNLEQ
jgi:hypothetical protein